MTRSVFGPKTSGIHIGPLNLGITVQVFQDEETPPDCFTLVATSPLGSSAKMTVANGASTTLDIVAGELAATVATDDWTPNLPGAPTMCSFKVVIRATGHVGVPPLPVPIPISVQIDAYDVVLHRSVTDFAGFIDSLPARASAAAQDA
jgi:hypothetical protein